MTDEQVASVMSDVKVLLGILDESKDGLLLYHIRSVAQKVLNYCNLEEMPDELLPVIVEMVIKAYNAWMQNSGSDGGFVATGVISSITRGDFSVSYDNSEEAAAASQSLASDDFLNQYKLQLQLFKRMRTVAQNGE